MPYIDCPHCGKRHISNENVELCRKIKETIKHLKAWATHETPTTTYYEEVTYLFWDTIRDAVHQRNANSCEACNVANVQFEVHHIWPRCKGGKNHLDNLKLLCLKCHYHAHSKRGKISESILQNKLI